MPPPSRFSFTPCEQKMPSLRSLPHTTEVWAAWISFTQQLSYYRDGAHLPTLSLNVWTATILVCFRSSDRSPAVVLDCLKHCLSISEAKLYHITLAVHTVQYAFLLPVPCVTCRVPQGSIPCLSVFPTEGFQLCALRHTLWQPHWRSELPTLVQWKVLAAKKSQVLDYVIK